MDGPIARLARVYRPGCIGVLLLSSIVVSGRGGYAGAWAQGQWLEDAQPRAWNAPGMPVPAAPRLQGNDDPRCAQFHRPPETPADAAVVRAGWTLYAAYQAGWGVTVLAGLVTHDGMCRPMGYQYFVFVDGTFAGTLAPEPMAARTDGSLGMARLEAAGDRLSADFSRYQATDALCCPSRRSFVQYQIVRGDAGAVVLPTAVQTMETSSAG